MSAGDHIQPQQLKMFMSPNEVMDEFWIAENAPERKLQQSMDDGLYDEISANGVQRPLRVVMSDNHTPPEVTNGHHRLFSQANIDPDRLMPITYDRSWAKAIEDKDDSILASDSEPSSSYVAEKAGWATREHNQ